MQGPIHWCDGYTFHEVSALVVPERRNDDSSWKYGFVYTMYKGKTTVELYSSIQEKVIKGIIVPAPGYVNEYNAAAKEMGNTRFMKFRKAAIEFNEKNAVKLAKDSGMTMEKYALKAHDKLKIQLGRMIDTFKINYIKVTAIYYPSGAGHDTGHSIDIVKIMCDDKDEAYFHNADSKEKKESKTVAEIFDWLIDLKTNPDVMDVYTPWRLQRRSAAKKDPYTNVWLTTEYSESDEDIYRAWTHNNHMHLRLKP